MFVLYFSISLIEITIYNGAHNQKIIPLLLEKKLDTVFYGVHVKENGRPSQEAFVIFQTNINLQI